MMQSIKHNPLFAKIENEQLESLLCCLGAKNRTYKKDTFIFRVDERATVAGLVLSGGVNIIQEDFWGNRTILAHRGAGDLFGEAFSCAEVELLPVSAVTTGVSEIMLIDYRKIITVCPTPCVFHSQLIFNMLRILAANNIMLTRKIEHISKRTTREKLLAFLSSQAVQAKSNTVQIPFNRQELADYLCVERSALSRELSEMKKAGLLDFEKNKFIILK